MASLTLNNRVLTLTDGEEVSSVDLSAVKGDDGCRGPQGPAGIIRRSDGTIDMSIYATETWVTEQIANVESGGSIDLSNYYTKTETDGRIASEISKIDVNADLSDYYTKAETEALIPDVSGFATDDDIAQFATETFVMAKIAEAELSGSEVDLSAYATKDDVPTKTSQLTNDSGFATETYVTNAIEEAQVGSEVDLSDYVTKDELPTNVSAFTNDAGYQTEAQVQVLIDAAIAALNGDEVEY